ncbi:kynurenine 3-monooxygenase [Catalinimonas alkaloidigena]|uniref:Kynurenine 3-monooxygenase n=1 Tax=Catalinimonas alkaloidigena TaxID=1075417 RepID=A0A1G9DQZ5_9BACT|nr:NAD(P)/FAD-dependent oxidoreductase [Catalinimonas alkaloidigena]SDK66273.1 kynurenine 3-monooxygenase [Catalinimonas alkaloidigena]
MKHITVFGAGLVGSLLAIYLKQRGYRVTVCERRADPRRAGVVGGRSINLALSDRGWRALEGVGMAEQIREIALPMRGRMIHDLDGRQALQPYGTTGQCIYSVSRALLNEKLLDLAEQEGAELRFNERCLDVNFEQPTATLVSPGHPAAYTLETDFIFGADGAFSAVRSSLQKTDRFDYEQSYLAHGYKELSIPPTADGQWRLDNGALHIWPRHSFMLIALPNLDGSFTCTLFLPFDEFDKLDSPDRVAAFFQEHFPDVVPLMPDLQEEFVQNPTSSMVTVRCHPWVRGNVALIGDAAHALVPFYGQGMNAGFEDCRVLNELMVAHPDDWPHFLEQYQRQRKPNADAIAQLALQNFVEMRDRVVDPQFQLRKKIEAQLHQQYPDEWVPLYTMVTFSHRPYAEALRLGRKQDDVMKQLLREPDLEARWDHPETLEKAMRLFR